MKRYACLILFVVAACGDDAMMSLPDATAGTDAAMGTDASAMDATVAPLSTARDVLAVWTRLGESVCSCASSDPDLPDDPALCLEQLDIPPSDFPGIDCVAEVLDEMSGEREIDCWARSLESIWTCVETLTCDQRTDIVTLEDALNHCATSPRCTTTPPFETEAFGIEIGRRCFGDAMDAGGEDAGAEPDSGSPVDP